MSQVHQQYTFGANTKPFEQGIARMENASRKGSKNITQNLVTIGQQAQDIGVGLTSGQKPMTVLLQQGTQLAAIFGTKGIVVAGIFAVGAAIWQVASGFKAAKEEAADLKKIIAANKDVADTRDQADVAEARAEHGDEYADAMKRALTYEQRIADINLALKKGELNESQAAALKIDEQRKLVADQLLIARKKEAEIYKEIDASAANTAKHEKELAELSMTPDERMMDMARQIGDAQDTIDRPGVSALDQQKAYEKRAALQVELAKLGKDQGEKQLSAEKEAAKTAEEAQKKKLAGFDKINKALDEMSEKERKLNELAGDIDAAKAKEKREKAYARGEATLESAARLRMTPAERSAARREARAEERSVSRAASRTVEDEDKIRDANGNVVGRRGLTAADRAKRKGEILAEANQAKNKDKIEAKFAEGQVDKLTKSFAEEVRKLIAT